MGRWKTTKARRAVAGNAHQPGPAGRRPRRPLRPVVRRHRPLRRLRHRGAGGDDRAPRPGRYGDELEVGFLIDLPPDETRVPARGTTRMPFDAEWRRLSEYDEPAAYAPVVAARVRWAASDHVRVHRDGRRPPVLPDRAEAWRVGCRAAALEDEGAQVTETGPGRAEARLGDRVVTVVIEPDESFDVPEDEFDESPYVGSMDEDEKLPRRLRGNCSRLDPGRSCRRCADGRANGERGSAGSTPTRSGTPIRRVPSHRDRRAVPVGSGSAYETCCGPLHVGARQAETPEELMRSRYSAYARGSGRRLPHLASADPPGRGLAPAGAGLGLRSGAPGRGRPRGVHRPLSDGRRTGRAP